MPATLAVVDRDSALEFLFGRINYERTTQIPYRTGGLKLERMQQLLQIVGDPHIGMPVVHVAGTKGKGSTATMVARILQTAGYRTGLYTSPHLERLEERFVINGLTCSEPEFVRLAADLQAATYQLEARDPLNRTPTFFEITTTMGLLHFARSRADVVVLEVGLGGRLDSTNICRPTVCAITSISFDHVRQLGNSLAAIAREKAGIIKPGIPVVSSVCEAEPREVIERIAAEQNSPLIQRDVDFTSSILTDQQSAATQLLYREPGGPAAASYQLGPLPIGMIGEHQALNAATAIATVRQLPHQRFTIHDAAIRQALWEAKCPARVEVLQQRPTVIVDVAHNVASIAALIEALTQRFIARRRILVFASSRDKDTSGMLKLLLPKFDHVVLTKFVNNPRAVEPEELRVWAQQALLGSGHSPQLELTAEPQAAWQRARALAQADDLVCITGSFFLAAELLPTLHQASP
ncbi:Folylpolyglutamate synthase [Anatilimnocola aggregata]|uniref:Dihydrofolate synthase/folylpolyglutamate synthase n=1 Tax=Anatilimnocola aggregata TaxID=2528021 RepID=A0A517Y5F2_9BACT|nr:folylpolyglutamate synthase/dihydrofolate synthase family protein [Anatilimnocola aggregata]QDU25468.1 Folylpolyglutamate synthase [Anatilimnocola aggregata]